MEPYVALYCYIKKYVPKDIRRLIMIAAAPQKALRHFTRFHRLDMIKTTVDLGADNYIAAAKIACELGYINIIKYLISRGLDVADERNILLKTACVYGRLDIIKFLTNQGVKLNSLNWYHYYVAHKYGYNETIELLNNDGFELDVERLYGAKMTYDFIKRKGKTETENLELYEGLCFLGYFQDQKYAD